MRLDADARRLGRDAILGTNRAVWTLSLAVWLVILAVGSYLGRVALHPTGAASLLVTFAVGLAYVATRGRGAHRALGIAANGLLAAELLVYFATHERLGTAHLVGGLAVGLLVLGVPLAVLVARPPSKD